MTDLAPSSSLDIGTEIPASCTAWDLAFDKADAKAIASAYAPNAKVLPSTREVVSGSAAIENFSAGLFSRGFIDHNLTIIDAGGDDTVISSTANWSAKGKGGAPQTAGGLATHIFERQADGSLKLRLHTFN
jgi:ketosteroid isomerase-like protein